MISRALIIIGFILAVFAAVASFLIYSSYQTEREQRLDSESKLMQAQDAATVMKADIEQQKSRMGDLDAQIQSLKIAEKEYKTQQAATSSELSNLKNQLKSKQDEFLRLQSQLENYRKKERIAAITAAKAASNSSTEMASGSAPGTATVSQENITSPPATLPVIPSEAPVSDDSRILTVNRKFNFIVVNLGLRDGLRMGDKVKVVQGDTQKALAQIEKIYDKFSAATLLDEDKGNPVHEGDFVRKV